ncbi:MAG: hypothetical protein H7A46_08955 [Verrucomicrobiales bacterium]|nr:hypothetical protein [Verrucomicrobiales bacterium]
MKPESPSPAPFGDAAFEVPLDRLALFVRGLVRALAETGLGASEIDAVVRRGLRVDCVGCGIVLTADDLSHLAVDQEAPANEPARLNRLRLGYCARNSCESRYYRIRVIDPGGLDWSALLAKAGDLTAGPTSLAEVPEEPEPTDGVAPPPPPARRRPLLIAALALLAAAVLWHFWDDLPIHPEKPPKYRIDPGSLPRY